MYECNDDEERLPDSPAYSPCYGVCSPAYSPSYTPSSPSYAPSSYHDTAINDDIGKETLQKKEAIEHKDAVKEQPEKKDEQSSKPDKAEQKEQDQKSELLRDVCLKRKRVTSSSDNACSTNE